MIGRWEKKKEGVQDAGVNASFGHLLAESGAHRVG